MRSYIRARLLEAGIEIDDKNRVLASNIDKVFEVLASESKYRDAAKVFEDFPNAVIIDGDDDWYSAEISHPFIIASEANIKKLGTYHSGHSGISSTGIIIDKKDLPKFKKTFEKMAKDPKMTKGKEPNYRAVEKPHVYELNVFNKTLMETLKAKGTQYGLSY